MSEDHCGEQMPVESADDAVLRMLGSTSFAPVERITLPSGRVLTGDEAQAFTSAFNDKQPSHSNADDIPPLSAGRSRDLDNPLSSANDDWTGDPATDRARLVQRALAANELHARTDQITPRPES